MYVILIYFMLKQSDEKDRKPYLLIQCKNNKDIFISLCTI